ncbi:hypothetical protein BCR35DRAFT_301334 [Leucosporidium creatinivorum]|uniref:Uncharacterized protein n=1 Tax=Leucosporidium creatinivorum TaxID=106004 RepID=A0A1Y2FZE1_9BASI|nr:hypothetical protein BCR35DRAFT_301334 [Leucosporidium creatinivorum]
MGLSDMIARARSASANTRSSSGWSPADSLPSGFQSTSGTYSLPLSSFSSLEFATDKGQWSKGTVLFTREQSGGSGLPSYGAPPPALDGKEQISEIKVQVEARSNSEALLNGWKVTVLDEGYVAGLKLETTDSSPLAAALSFHVTFILPASLTGLNGLRVNSNGFRLLFDSSLASNFAIASLSLRTTDAPIRLSLTNAGDVRISNENILDPDKGGIKCPGDLVSGSVQAESISLEVQNGSISGNYTSTVGPISAATTNFPITGSFTARTTLHLSTSNSTLAGEFTSLAPPSATSSVAGITVETAQGKVEGTFHAPSGVRVTSQNCPIVGSFTVGALLVLKTTHFKIEGKIRLLSPSSALLPDTVVGSPSPSVLSAGSAEPPSFQEALRQGASSSTAAGGTSRAQVLAETTEGALFLEFEDHPADVVVALEASSTRGGKVGVKHPAGWEGSFTASTGLMNSASLDFPPSSLTGASSITPEVNYTVKKRSEIAGTVGNGGNSTKLSGTNSVDIVVG